MIEKVLLVLVSLLSSGALAYFPPMGAEDMSFVYQELTGDFRKFPCRHEKADVGLYEWDVWCEKDGRTHSYYVHLVMTRYPNTTHGLPAHELLYWVTDLTTTPTRHDSTTLWLYHSEPNNRLPRVEASVGIEDDQAYLRLILTPREPGARNRASSGEAGASVSPQSIR